MRRDADGGACHPVVSHELHCGNSIRPIRGVAIADENRVLDRKCIFGGNQRLDGARQERVEVGHVAGCHAVDFAEEIAFPRADFLERNHPTDAVATETVLHEADHILRVQPVDREACDVLLPLVAVGHFGGVHDENEAAATGRLNRFDLAIDGERRLDRRALIATGAVRIRPADHDEPATLIVDRRANRFHLIGSKRLRRHVREDDAIEVTQEQREVRFLRG